MLSYRHAFHAGNLADVHKHALLAWALDAMAAKPKPLTYLETHAGRALYDLDAPEARKTGEAARGIDRMLASFPASDPYRRAIESARAAHGPRAYPGSPLLASLLLRPDDRLRLAELHPAEAPALRRALPSAAVEHGDGLRLALAWTPPTPRRGLLLVDPSWEVKADYDAVPKLLERVATKWPVGVLLLWYPLLADGRHAPMLARLGRSFPGALRHEVRWEGGRMDGSGLLAVNPPWGLEARAAWLTDRFAAL